jgi:hypothetical protein
MVVDAMSVDGVNNILGLGDELLRPEHRTLEHAAVNDKHVGTLLSNLELLCPVDQVRSTPFQRGPLNAKSVMQDI